MTKVVAYLRVSTDKQDASNQKFEIEKFCNGKGMAVGEWVTDNAVSGKVKAVNRKLGEIITGLGSGDILIVTEISRLGRDWFDILTSINECMVKGVAVFAIKNGYELKNDAMGKLFVSIMAVFAEEERKLLSERVKMALSRKKSEGMVLGRPVGSKQHLGVLEYVKVMRKHNIPVGRISSFTGINRMTLNQYLTI